jgi:hypothetical protein
MLVGPIDNSYLYCWYAQQALPGFYNATCSSACMMHAVRCMVILACVLPMVNSLAIARSLVATCVCGHLYYSYFVCYSSPNIKYRKYNRADKCAASTCAKHEAEAANCEARMPTGRKEHRPASPCHLTLDLRHFPRCTFLVYVHVFRSSDGGR